MRNKTLFGLSLTFAILAGCDNRGDTGVISILEHKGVHAQKAEFRIAGTRSGAAFDENVEVPCSDILTANHNDVSRSVLALSTISGILKEKTGITNLVLRLNSNSQEPKQVYDTAAQNCAVALGQPLPGISS